MIDEFGKEIGEPCEECGRAQGKIIMGMGSSALLLCEECADAYDDEQRAQEARDDTLTADEIHEIETAHYDGNWQ